MRRHWALALSVLLIHCAEAAPAHGQGDPARGAATWVRECAQCHTLNKAWDLSHFQYPDTTITRRALAHVSASDAADIIAHVKALVTADTMTPKRRPFQPGNVVLSSDQEFGVRLFGSDQWPVSLTRAQLLAHDPTRIPIALPLPPWSDEMSGYEWLPGSIATGQLPAGVRAAAQGWFDRYNASPSIATAVLVSRRIRTVAHDLNIKDAPCLFGKDNSRYDAQKCVDVGKWTAAFLYQEGVRSGNLHGAAQASTGEWWETGHLVHKAQQFKRPLPERDLQIAGWMHLGWMWDRALRKKASYEAGPLAALGLHRHATWLILRSMVERDSRGLDVCTDVMNVAQWGATVWMLNALSFAYRELQYRDARGLLPTNRAFCVEQIRLSQVWVNRRMSAVMASAEGTALRDLAAQTSQIVR